MNQYQKHRIKKCMAFVFAACLCGFVVVCGTGCAKHKKQASESIADIQKREGIPVRTMTITPGTIEAAENVGGTAEGFFQDDYQLNYCRTHYSHSCKSGRLC